MNRPCILVIDDDELVCDILKTSLTDAGFLVDAVLEPETALKKFREQSYDTVIVDVALPRMDGMELLESFKRINPETTVIVVTGYPDVNTAQKAVQNGAFDYISKPFELREIVLRARKAVEKTRSLREQKERERALNARLNENLREIEFQSNALKVEQERFYGIFKSANFGLMVLNGLDEKIILVNDRCKELLRIGHLSDEHCFDRDFHHLVPSVVSEHIDRMVGELRETLTVAKVDSLILGSDKILELQSYPVISDGLMLAVVIMINDITERKRLEKQLLMASKLAGIGELAAGIAHEINNPIGFVKSNMGTLNEYVEELTKLIDMYHDLRLSIEDDRDPSAQIEKIKSYEEQIDSGFVLNDIEKIVSENQDGLGRVARIIRDLRTFTRFDDEKKVRVDVNRVIEEALTLTRNECKYKAEVKKELSELPEIFGYGSQLAQVFINLIINAAHAIENKGEIVVRSFLDGKNIVVEVADNGKGIREDLVGRIFDPFFTTKPSDQGTGLGLSIAQEIVAKHGGTISVSSQVGKGTTFRVEMPAKFKPEKAVRL